MNDNHINAKTITVNHLLYTNYNTLCIKINGQKGIHLLFLPFTKWSAA